MSNGKVSLRLVEIQTAKVEIPIEIPGTEVKGFVDCTIFVRSKNEMKELGDQIADGKFEDDVSVLKVMYQEIRGLGDESGKAITGDDVWAFLGGESKLGAYLSNAFTQAYFGQYGEALNKNLRKRR